jgi:hypothetical protein
VQTRPFDAGRPAGLMQRVREPIFARINCLMDETALMDQCHRVRHQSASITRACNFQGEQAGPCTNTSTVYVPQPDHPASHPSPCHGLAPTAPEMVLPVVPVRAVSRGSPCKPNPCLPRTSALPFEVLCQACRLPARLHHITTLSCPRRLARSEISCG